MDVLVVGNCWRSAAMGVGGRLKVSMMCRGGSMCTVRFRSGSRLCGSYGEVEAAPMWGGQSAFAAGADRVVVHSWLLCGADRVLTREESH